MQTDVEAPRESLSREANNIPGIAEGASADDTFNNEMLRDRLKAFGKAEA